MTEPFPDYSLPPAMLERYFQLHAPELRTERLRRRIAIEQQNYGKQLAILDLLLSLPLPDREGRPPRLLDIGAGIGAFAHRARLRGLDALGVEPSIEQIQCHQEHLGRPGVLVNAVGEALPFADDSFDCLVSMSVLEHCQDVEAYLREALRVLRPGGWFYLVFPNYRFVWEPHYDVFWLPFLPRALNRLYLRLRGRDPGFLDTLNLTTPGAVRRLLERLPAHVEDLSLKTCLDRLADPARIGVPSLSRAVAVLNGLGLRPLLAGLAGLGLYHPAIWLIRKTPAGAGLGSAENEAP